MSRRGRPKTADILTPREYEVLELIRDGLSNKEIAERLGISLAGAKFHVSEIISKLGVEGREEAAAWAGGKARSRWGFFPLTWSPGGLLPSPMKLLAGVAGAVVVTGLLTGSGVVSFGSDGTQGSRGPFTVLPTPTPGLADPCAEIMSGPDVGCISFGTERLYLASLEEAAEFTSFVARLPVYVPSGYLPQELTYMWPGELLNARAGGGLTNEEALQGYEPKGPNSPFERLTASYGSADESLLVINQGYGLSVAHLWEQAPDHLRGSEQHGDREVRWYQGSPKYEQRTGPGGVVAGFPLEGEWEDNGHVAVFWQQYGISRGAGWEIEPDGTRRTFELRGRPFEYVIFSTSLPLDELLKVAASVPRD